MFWNDPNLYGATLPYKDIPVQNPLLAWQNFQRFDIPRFDIPRFVPPMFGFTPNYLPYAQFPQIPQVPQVPMTPHMQMANLPYTQLPYTQLPYAQLPFIPQWNYNFFRPF